MIIAVDGPSASGKGTLARAIAARLGYHYLDTGSLYRMVGLTMLREGRDETDIEAATQIARSLDPSQFDDSALRSETVAAITSKIAAIPEVRAALLAFQRDYAKRAPGAVLDGRDIGTIVCPDADFKFYVTASAQVRAMRRFWELQASGVTLEQVETDLAARDTRDAIRSAPAPDAVVIDTSEMTADECLRQVMRIVGAQ
jgi:CMP/dCMP kinase